MKPILFNTDMVKAILAGKKTVTRRVIKNVPENAYPGHCVMGAGLFDNETHQRVVAAPYKPGDVLYVREMWCDPSDTGWPIIYKADLPMHWDAEETEHGEAVDLRVEDFKWRPSIHMPKEAARIFLRVTAVRAERLQSITPEQAIREGISRMFDHLPDDEYIQWAARVAPGKKKTDWGWDNYLWHGDFGSYGMGNKLSDAWPYQYSGYDEPVGSFSSLWNRTLPLKEWPAYGWEANPWVWVIEFERCASPWAEKEAEK